MGQQHSEPTNFLFISVNLPDWWNLLKSCVRSRCVMAQWILEIQRSTHLHSGIVKKEILMVPFESLEVDFGFDELNGFWSPSSHEHGLCSLITDPCISSFSCTFTMIYMYFLYSLNAWRSCIPPSIYLLQSNFTWEFNNYFENL